jgi:DNA-directed RNA polymerase subunit F
MKIVESKPVSVCEAKELLDAREKKAELEYEQMQASEHATKFSPIKAEAAKKVAAQLTKLNEKLDIEIALKIVDISPKKPETLKSILLRRRIELEDAEIEELLKSLEKH